MHRIVFGIAFAQVLATLIFVLLQLAVSFCFWWIVERVWQTVQGWSQAVIRLVPWTRMRAV